MGILSERGKQPFFMLLQRLDSTPIPAFLDAEPGRLREATLKQLIENRPQLFDVILGDTIQLKKGKRRRCACCPATASHPSSPAVMRRAASVTSLVFWQAQAHPAHRLCCSPVVSNVPRRLSHPACHAPPCRPPAHRAGAQGFLRLKRRILQALYCSPNKWALARWAPQGLANMPPFRRVLPCMHPSMLPCCKARALQARSLMLARREGMASQSWQRKRRHGGVRPPPAHAERCTLWLWSFWMTTC